MKTHEFAFRSTDPDGLGPGRPSGENPAEPVPPQCNDSAQPNPSDAGIRAPELGTILFVEDEPSVRTLGALLLRRAGYTVLCATDGEDAFSVCEHVHPHLDLLLTDVVMPRMNGPELARRLSETYPHLPVLFTSGYTREMVAELEQPAPPFHFLQKPYTMRELVEHIETALHTRHE